MRLPRHLPYVAALTIALASCSPAASSAGPDPDSAAAVVSDVSDHTTAIVHRTSTCGCCGGYEQFLTDRGFEVVQQLHDDLISVRAELGVPDSERSCHTTQIGGYTIEGHMPLLAIRKLLAEQPDIDGIALAGMPVGSPGMPGTKTAPFVVTALKDGEVVGEFGTY